MSEFRDRDSVVKVNGYRFPGVVVCSFTTLKGRRRYVVECTAPEVEGCLHIFSGRQLAPAPEQGS